WLLVRRCFGHGFFGQRTELYRGSRLGTIAPDGQPDGGVGRLASNGAAEVECVIDRVAIDGGDDVTGLDAGRAGRTILGDIADNRALGLFEANAIGDVTRHVLDADAEIAAGHGAAVDQLVDDTLDRGSGDGEGDTDIAAIGRINGGIDAHHFTLGVEGRAARIAGVHRRIDLQEVAIVRAADIAAGTGDDANGHGAAKTEGIAHGHDPVADAAGFGLEVDEWQVA